MKNQLKSRFGILVVFSALLLLFGIQNLCAQDAEKNSIRLRANYVKIMGGEMYFDLKATARVDGENVIVPNIEFLVYNEFNDESVEIGKTTTNAKGVSKFVLKNLNSIKPDSTNTYNILFSFDGNDAFKRISKSVTFKNAEIKTTISTIDSINYITATLLDVSKDSLMGDQSLTVQVQRIFRPLFIGEEFNVTDEDGTVIVPLEEGIPGVGGNLTVEVVLNESEVYGTVKAIVIAPVGTPFVDESTFDQRKMWSPRNKTPLFLLIFPNIIIFTMWGLIIYLFYNLFKIFNLKSKIKKHENI